ncbi:hypothetical protein M422DRAFT_261040 [Sphaerobolus stellatus SS14]|uniref:Uncharacterized protein n=1 Tax=Sphaerobolus stellatus (strain SS14) TaxID=990650 RepID=A0A0C9VFX2_SPHS4|nr:hypothetical protein M422DRAFT_261040 [Sphaerobolus stellatus SS14]
MVNYSPSFPPRSLHAMRSIAFLSSLLAAVSAGPIPDSASSQTGPDSIMTSPTPSSGSASAQASVLASNPTSTVCPTIPAPSSKVASAWWPDYRNANITFEKYNHLMYSFAIPSQNGSAKLPTLG